MSDTDRGFKMTPPDLPHSPEVRNFFSSNPELNITESLRFLDEHYPDKDSWVVDSGVAIQLLTGKREIIPGDLDIVCRTDDMEADFGHTNGLNPEDNRYIDVKSISHWLRGRVTNADEQLVWEGIVATSSMHEVDGVTFRVMHPAIIAAGKSTLARMSPRPKDASDLALLSVPPAQLTAATELLRGHGLEEHVQFLMHARQEAPH